MISTPLGRVHRTPSLHLLYAVLAFSGAALSAQQEQQEPWRLDKALSTPDWLKISGEVRLRYEGIEGQFRANPRIASSDHYFVSRSILKAELDFDGIGAVVEGMDSRHYGAGTRSFMNTSVVNPVDFLQAHAKLSFGELENGRHTFKAGRSTIDLGSRRLVARNKFRNTINAFDGVEYEYEDSGGNKLHAFWNLPVRRKPFRLNDLLDNEAVLDDQDRENQFYGAFFETSLSEQDKLEVYMYGLDEQGQYSLRRNIYTPGFRVLRAPAKEAVDYEFEAAGQFGEVGSLSGRQDRLAYFFHASMGYTFDAAWSPRVRLAWDYASGDDNPNDGDSGRFDTLFGARRFEYGPTGIYGAIARANLNSPEIRVVTKPVKDLNWMVAARAVWLAEATDFAPAGGVRDVTGSSGTHLGEQIETRLRWDVAPKNVRLEVGGAYLFAGDFLKNAPNGRGEDVAYAYAQMFLYF